MAAITKAFTAIADTAVDPDSPVDTALVTALRDNTTHLREWLGASFYAGAAQDHAHDGTDSALVEIGPNLLRNGSFENGESSWTFTDYSGGSHAISAAEYIHGIKSLAITSTVLANGGGYAESNEYVPVGGSQFLSFEIWRWASVANISSKCEVVWYDNAKAQISVTAVYSDTNTPTAKTLVQTGLQAPSTARYARLRVTGGVPGTGTATGTVYFDGGLIGRTYVVEPLIGPAAVTEPKLGAASVTQSRLKTTTSSGSSAGAGSKIVSLAGGTYSWWTMSADSSDGAGGAFGNNDTGAGVIGITIGGSGPTLYWDERYVQASPPYTHGPLFVFLALDASGKITWSQVAPDPPWAYHGPTDITPQYFRKGKAYRLVKKINGLSMHAAMRDPATLTALMSGTAKVTEEEVEITLAYKDSDMAVMPHPFVGNNLTGLRVVLLEPGTTLMERLAGFCDCDEAREARNLILDGKLIIDNTPLAIPNTPPGVMPVRARWKLTS